MDNYTPLRFHVRYAGRKNLLLFRLLFLFLFTVLNFFTIYDLYAQVTIKDRVDIHPHDIPFAIQASSGELPSITVVMEWDADPMGRILIGGDCIGSYSESGNNIITHTIENAPAGNYSFQPQFASFGQFISVDFNFKIYLNGELMKEVNDLIAGRTQFYTFGYYIHFTISRVSNFTASVLHEKIFASETNSISIETRQDCNPASWDVDQEPLNLTVVDGEEFGYFIDEMGNALGTEVSVYLDDLPNISYKPENLFHADPVIVSINISTSQISRVVEFIIESTEDLIITADTEVVTPGIMAGIDKTATISVKAWQENAPSPSFPVILEVVPVNDGDSTGTLLQYSGTTDQTGSFTTTFIPPHGLGENWIIVSSPNTEIRDSVKIAIIYIELTLRSERDPVAHGDSSLMHIEAVDLYGEFVPVPEVDPPLPNIFQIITMPGGTQYGVLFYGGIERDYHNIQKEDGRSASFYYKANGEEPDDTSYVVFGMAAFYEGGLLRGFDTLRVVPSSSVTIEITMIAGREVWPTLPEAQQGSTDYKPDISNTINFVVSVFDGNDEPVQNHSVEIRGQMREGSGGHDHTNAPPENRLGPFRNTRTGESDQDNLVTSTGEDGMIEIQYTAMPYGGILDITAESQDFGIEANDSIFVRVPGLVELPEGEDYILIGQTERHLSNHWGAADVIDSLQSIASDWRELFPNEAKLMINDISVEYGGIFDIWGNWTPPHSLHRTGRDIDLRTEFPEGIDDDPLRPGVPIRSPRNGTEIEHVVGNLDFERLVKEKGARNIRIHGVYNTRDEHYHIYF